MLSPQGNNMYLSLGNIVANPRAGLLFINRETGARRRRRYLAPKHVNFVLGSSNPTVATDRLPSISIRRRGRANRIKRNAKNPVVSGGTTHRGVLEKINEN